MSHLSPADLGIKCVHCAYPVGVWSHGRLKIHVKSRVLAIQKGGEVEMTCPHCSQPTTLPLIPDQKYWEKKS